jgi:hypothetical protein
MKTDFWNLLLMDYQIGVPAKPASVNILFFPVRYNVLFIK